MTLSREQLILAECLSRLTGAPLGPVPAPVGLGVDRSHLRELAPGKLPWISLYPMEASTTRKGSASETPLLVKVAIWVKGTPNEAVDQDLDPLWLWVHQQLLTDESLGGLSMGIQPVQKVWGFYTAQAPFGDLDLHYLITYRHHSADPTRPA